ncbi:hypothetical protein JD844_004155 [Phrynosoma platyrhinos]|uniref:Uncharacterized protein n=1 Tax=Phrynosoma platyrhinos TaxID=52577 RepID=A0ABQ7TNX3_PHRPL|nr:hypothetical protein JD844_004155 [Phrynosoma platyrhinos]
MIFFLNDLYTNLFHHNSYHSWELCRLHVTAFGIYMVYVESHCCKYFDEGTIRLKPKHNF